MRKFRFKSISLLSRKEKRARRETFSLGRNLILGPNHTGKSTLIKSLFGAFGAIPEGKLEQWDENATVLVEFSVDEVSYAILWQNKFRGLFAQDGKLIDFYANATDWGIKFCEITGFNLVLADNNKQIVIADARAFFLPFYINQDGSWGSQWNTFKNLKQYWRPIRPILEYFTGVRPSEYYKVHSETIIARGVLQDIRREQATLEQMRGRLGSSLALAGPKSSLALFEQDIVHLASEMTALNASQERLREAEVRQRETLASAQMQARLARAALQDYEGDAKFLRRETHQRLICPTCGAEHEKSFLELIGYAEDARVLRELAFRLEIEVKASEEQYKATQDQLMELQAHFKRLSSVLEIRRGDLNLGDIIKGFGAEFAFEIFEIEASKLANRVHEQTKLIETFDSSLKNLTSRKRLAAVLKEFRAAYAQACEALSVDANDIEKANLGGRPDVSGSGGPRSTLAYYSAIWKTASGEFSSFSVPAVIDSPQQQGQDGNNLPRMIKHITTNLPDGCQVILGAETDTDEIFDKRIRLKNKYQLLSVEEFDAVNALMEPYIAQMYDRSIQPVDPGQ